MSRTAKPVDSSERGTYPGFAWEMAQYRGANDEGDRPIWACIIDPRDLCTIREDRFSNTREALSWVKRLTEEPDA